MSLDVEGYTPVNYKKVPRLLDMNQVRGLNRCKSYFFFPIITFILTDPLNMDEIDQMIADRNESALQKLVLNGEYSKIENRIFPPQSQDLARTLQNLNVKILFVF